MFKNLIIEYYDNYVYVVSETPEGFFIEVFNSEVENGFESAKLLKTFFEDTFNSVVDLEELEKIDEEIN